MKNIKIFVTHTPNKKSRYIQNNCMNNIVAGADFNNSYTDFLLDNKGDNISKLNKSYCELTTQYWAWKNVDADYYGFCHYRRLFSFNDEKLPVTQWGTIEYDYMTDDSLKELCIDEKCIHESVEGFDFIIAEGVDLTKMPTPYKSVYDHYASAVDLHKEDYDLMMEIIEEKYNYLLDSAKEYSQGKILYSCNMFIMKRELFDEYCEVLFDILKEFDKKSDMSNYSREGYRTPGHLGERLAGIYYLYQKKQGKLKLKEMQIALFHDTSVQENHEFIKDAVPLVLAANDYYVPILSTCLQSVVDNITSERLYDCVILHTDISLEHQKVINEHFQSDKFRISFVNVSKNIYGYILKAKEHISTETFYRFLILDLLEGYDKVLYLDVDMIIKSDIAELYDIELGTNLIGASLDPDFLGQINIRTMDTREYCCKTLGLEKAEDYFQAGVLIMNVKELKKNTSVSELFNMADTGIYRYSDQDILNVICKNRVTYIDMAWNYIYNCNDERYKNIVIHSRRDICEAYESARKAPKIIHFAGWKKPWDDPNVEYGQEFWKYARNTPYYEMLFNNLVNGHISQALWDAKVYKEQKGKKNLRWFVTGFYCTLFPEGSRRRAFARRAVKPLLGEGASNYMNVPEHRII